MSQQLLAYQECVHGISAKPGTNINTRLLSAKDYGETLQLGRWTEWQGAPGPLTWWAAGPELGQCWAGAHLMSRLPGWAEMWQTESVVVVGSQAELGSEQ
ncbi:hypothetical protein KUCAC02_001636 [Chaenocephalus aceratus]|uniref:Uncharacterized protein n=1 Tax=Chaenocephalus aceratus TaxID=36190 RepID=A0ACB9XT34_CHAAC|nr:hypothetical protein KUCAC02_001636 [Chaenocephalus aceratus]